MLTALTSCTMNMEEQKEEKSAEQPPTKKLKCAEPDLKVTIGSDSSDNPLVEYHHSIVLAKHSAYVDTMLDSAMIESKTMEINFPDITPDTWKKLLSFIEDPVASRSNCSIRDVLECLPFYNKYDFTKGFELCEHILKAYLNELLRFKEKNDTTPHDLDTLVDSAVLTHGTQLASVLPLTMSLMKSLICEPVHTIKLKRSHVKELVPFIAENVEEFYPNGAMTEEEVLSPLFPRYVINKAQKMYTHRLAKAAATRLQINGTVLHIDGVYTRTTAVTWVAGQSVTLNDENLRIWIVLGRDGCWQIVGKRVSRQEGQEPCLLLWECPNSKNYPFPPYTGWKVVLPLLNRYGTPTISFIFGNTSN